MLYVGYVLKKRLDVNAIIDSVVTSDLIRMCVFGSALYHCYNGGKDCSTVSHALAVPRDTAGICDVCAILIMDIIIFFPRQTRVYMLLSEGLLILGICGQT